MEQMPFAVVDLETTGFSHRLHDRIVEIAIVRVGPDGDAVDEYVTLVNPFRDVGPTRIHGITATDVAQAPGFQEIVGDILERLQGAVFVAHNAAFDHAFLAAELSAAGVFVPEIPRLCTLRLAHRMQPELRDHKLATCCGAIGFVHDKAHGALEDARAGAHLLAAYLDLAQQQGMSLADLGCSPLEFPKGWPRLDSSGRRVMRPDGRVATGDMPYLAKLVVSLGRVGTTTERTAPYVDLLDRALEDRLVTQEEAAVLQETAIEWGLSREEVLSAHHSYVESLVGAALADGTVSELERRDLEAVTRLLAVDPSIVQALLGQGIVPATNIAGGRAPLRDTSLVGKSVCFTGSLLGTIDGAPITRQVAHELATAAGLHVTERVTNKLDLLVASDANTQSGKGKAARKHGTRVMAEAAFWRAIGAPVD
ncbi:MAG: exonuclease domain-containing protein [Planctomycetales bacterium]